VYKGVWTGRHFFWYGGVLGSLATTQSYLQGHFEVSTPRPLVGAACVILWELAESNAAGAMVFSIAFDTRRGVLTFKRPFVFWWWYLRCDSASRRAQSHCAVPCRPRVRCLFDDSDLDIVLDALSTYMYIHVTCAGYNCSYFV
jgi:hypothetical protein